jgi:hypothetical protein
MEQRGKSNKKGIVDIYWATSNERRQKDYREETWLCH